MKARLPKLFLALILATGAVLASVPKAESACVPICDFTRTCCCGKVAAKDSCTGAKICANFCAF
jgi:hypothetical protein